MFLRAAHPCSLSSTDGAAPFVQLVCFATQNILVFVEAIISKLKTEIEGWKDLPLIEYATAWHKKAIACLKDQSAFSVLELLLEVIAFYLVLVDFW